MASNGHIPISELTPVYHPSLKLYLADQAAAGWNSLRLYSLHRYGQDLYPGGADSAYRTYERQVYWRNYWCSRGLCGNAAVPGTSNHGLAKACDCPDANQQAFLRKHGPKAGWTWGEAPSEPWHFTFTGNFKHPNPGLDPKHPVARRGSGGPVQDWFVKDLQRELGKHGFKVKVDGDFGRTTDKAVRNLQKSFDLKNDGIVGKRTWEKLRGPAILKPGMKGPRVKALTRDLSAAWCARRSSYYLNGKRAVYGDAVKSAVADFQSDRGLKVDGIAGPETLRRLATAVENERKTVKKLRSVAKRLRERAREAGQWTRRTWLAFTAVMKKLRDRGLTDWVEPEIPPVQTEELKTSNAGVKLLRKFEGCILTPYADAAGHATIGIGHLLHYGPVTQADRDKWGKITIARAIEILHRDLADVEEALHRLVKVPLNQQQFDALVSLTFNIGAGAFEDSTLLRLLNEGKYGRVPAEILRWDKAGDPPRPVEGLTRRREAEAKLFKG